LAHCTKSDDEPQNSTNSGINIKTGDEEEFYHGEFIDFLIDTLSQASQNQVLDSRRSHIIKSFLGANTKIGKNEEIRTKIEQILHGYTNMTSQIRKGLEDLGFEIKESGKHYKIVFYEDNRYTFSLPKSGSDRRGSQNAISDIKKLIF
jgi:hypothetical protein